MENKSWRDCPNGHRYQKSSDCPVCPECEKEKVYPEFLTGVSAPARRAILAEGINSLSELSARSEKSLLKLHGLGKSSIPLLRKKLNEQNMDFAKD